MLGLAANSLLKWSEVKSSSASQWRADHNRAGPEAPELGQQQVLPEVNMLSSRWWMADSHIIILTPVLAAERGCKPVLRRHYGTVCRPVYERWTFKSAVQQWTWLEQNSEWGRLVYQRLNTPPSYKGCVNRPFSKADILLVIAGKAKVLLITSMMSPNKP